MPDYNYGIDPITGEPITVDPNLPVAPPTPPPAPPAPLPVDSGIYNGIIYYSSASPEPEDVPNTTHQGIAFTDAEVAALVDFSRRLMSTKKVLTILFVRDDDLEADSPSYSVDLSSSPIKISAFHA